MKLIDRITNKVVEAPPSGSKILAGMYLVPNIPSPRINGLAAPSSSPLVPDKQGKVTIQSGTEVLRYEFENDLLFQDLGPRQAFVTIAEELQLAESWEDVIGILPLISSIEGRLELTEMEMDLYEGLFHIESICNLPSAKLTRIQEKTPVGRAKRIPTRAIEYLSGHSEDWVRRKYRSVQPRAIIAEHIEETIDIYENQVTARLIHRLLRYLRTRIEEELLRMIGFMERLDKMLQRNKPSDQNWYPKVNRNYELAGKAYQGDIAKNQETSQKTLQVLKEIRSRLFKLLQTPFFFDVNNNTSIEPVLRMTNKFLDHQHYRVAARFWNQLNQEVVEKSPEALQQDHLQAMQAFHQFCGLLLLRALQLLHFKPKGTAKRIDTTSNSPIHLGHPHFAEVMLTFQASGIWEIRIGQQEVTRWVGIPSPIHESTLWQESQLQNQNGLHILYLYQPAPLSEKPAIPLLLSIGKPTFPAYIPVSPEDFDSTERVARMLMWHLVEDAWAKYPISIQSRQTSLITELLNKAGIKTEPNANEEVTLGEIPLGFEGKLEEVMNEKLKGLAAKSHGKQLDSEKNNLLDQETVIKRKVKLAQKFPFCPLCGSADGVEFQPRDKGDFVIYCATCNAEARRQGSIPSIRPKNLLELLRENVLEDASFSEAKQLDELFGRDLLAIPSVGSDGKAQFRLTI